MAELCYENCKKLLAVNYFRKKVHQIFDRVLNIPLMHAKHAVKNA